MGASGARPMIRRAEWAWAAALAILLAMHPSPGLGEEPAGSGWARLRPEREPIARTFTGIASGDGRVFYFGGGHAGWPGNDVEVYDIGRNTWQQSYPPDMPAAGSKAARALDSGGSSCEVDPRSRRPYTEHTYQQYAYVATGKRLVAQLCRRTWAYDPETREWTDLRPGGSPFAAPRAPQVYTGELALSWDERLARVVVLGTMSYRRVYHYDPVANVFESKAAHPLTPWAAWPRMAYSPDHGRHLVVHAGRAFLYDAARDEWTPRRPPPRHAGAVTYDTARRRFAVWGLDKPVEHWGGPPARLTLSLYDPDRDAFDPVDLGQAPALRNAPMLPNVAAYDPGSDRYVLVLPVNAYTSHGWSWEAPLSASWIRVQTWAFRLPRLDPAERKP